MNMLRNFGKKAVAAPAALLVMAGSANAALPTGATDAFTTLSTDAGLVIDQVWPVMIVITVGFVTIGLVKRGLKKSVG